jgi:predicted unusual protein kinase regulating ubiquinone biosynthesis (AarF/ABC1/UbiB family)
VVGVKGRNVAVAAALAAATAVGAAAVVARRRRAPGSSGRVISATGRSARSAAIARFGARAGTEYAAHRARSVFASADRREELDEAFAMRTAEQVAAELGNLKGAMMKLGQMASYLDQGLPSPVRTALAELRQDAPPMSAELATGVLVDELGDRPEVLFKEWDPVPLASASIGQVHKAITHDDRAVAVKIQYPGVDEAIRADLENTDALFGAMGFLFGGLDADGIVAELKERLVEELDYRLEADNQRLFVDYYADHPFIRVPPVVDELSTGRVLTTELSSGARWEELMTWSQEERDLAGEAIYRFVFRSLYRLHAFNGDPHPGNYLFEPGGRVTFLDFGLVKRFTPEEVKLFDDLIDAFVLRGDHADFRATLQRARVIPEDTPLTDDQVAGWMGHFYELVLADQVTTITPEYSSQTMRQMFDVSGPNAELIRSANVPPSFVIIQRINLGLYAVLGELGATANWRRVANELWPFVDGPPSTRLGEEEAAWRKRTGR